MCETKQVDTIGEKLAECERLNNYLDDFDTSLWCNENQCEWEQARWRFRVALEAARATGNPQPPASTVELRIAALDAELADRKGQLMDREQRVRELMETIGKQGAALGALETNRASGEATITRLTAHVWNLKEDIKAMREQANPQPPAGPSRLFEVNIQSALHNGCHIIDLSKVDMCTERMEGNRLGFLYKGAIYWCHQADELRAAWQAYLESEAH